MEVFKDTFTDSDHVDVFSAHAPDIGSSWDTQLGLCEILSNKFHSLENRGGVLVTSTFLADVKIKMDCVIPSGTGLLNFLVVYRHQDISNYLVVYLYRASGTTALELHMSVVAGGGYTDVAVGTLNATHAGTTITLVVVANGNNHTAWVVGDSMAQLAHTHSDYNTQTRHGMWLDDTLDIDNFIIDDDLSVGSSSTIPIGVAAKTLSGTTCVPAVYSRSDARLVFRAILPVDPDDFLMGG